jgi:MFS family permease
MSPMTSNASPAVAASAAVPAPPPGADPPVTANPPRPAAVGTATPAAPPARPPLFSAAAWSPLKVELFRNLYVATSVAQIGTWAREAGSPSLMMLLTAGWKNQADMVGQITTYSNLPICLFSLLAGALADVLDRRRLLIWTNLWMIVVSVVLAGLTFAGTVTPWTLLGMTFLLGVGTAASGPALQAVLPELVPPKDMALAINLNSVALNVARAIGPATFILVVWVVPGQLAGIGASFLLSAMTFAAAVWVLWRWKREPQRAAPHGEGVLGAIRTGYRYVAHSRANRAILVRVAAFIVPALVLWSQVPVIAQNQLGMPRTPASYALLFAFVGLGAIVGVLLMPGLQARYRIDPVVNACTGLFALGLIVLSFVHHLWLAAFVLVFMGVNWVIIPTNFNTATQKSVPLWVKGRAISFYLTVLFGSFAVGGALWGKVTTAAGIQTSLVTGGLAMAALLLLAWRYPLTINDGLDLTPAYPKGSTPPPLPGADALPAAGRVELTAKYSVGPADERAFRRAAYDLGQQRRRNGAAGWRLARGRGAGQWVETAVYRSKAEYDRQFGRLTKADVKLQEKAAAYLARGEPTPVRVAGENLWV